MPNFFRLNKKGLMNLGEVPKLGFPTEDPSFIPDDYIKKGEWKNTSKQRNIIINYELKII